LHFRSVFQSDVITELRLSANRYFSSVHYTDGHHRRRIIYNQYDRDRLLTAIQQIKATTSLAAS